MTSPHSITTQAELDALPTRSAIRSWAGTLAEKGPDGNWYTPPLTEPIRRSTLLAGDGARVLDYGRWEEQLETS